MMGRVSQSRRRRRQGLRAKEGEEGPWKLDGVLADSVTITRGRAALSGAYWAGGDVGPCGVYHSTNFFRVTSKDPRFCPIVMWHFLGHRVSGLSIGGSADIAAGAVYCA